MEIVLDTHEGKARASARLQTPDGSFVIGAGHAHTDLTMTAMAEARDELAAARALTDLGHRLGELALVQLARTCPAPVSTHSRTGDRQRARSTAAL